MSVAVAEGEPAVPVLADTTNSLHTAPEPSKQEEVADLAAGKGPVAEAHAVDEPTDVVEEAQEAAPPAEEVQTEADASALSAEPVALVNGAKDAVHESGEVRILLLVLRSYVAHTLYLYRAVLAGHRSRGAEDRCRARRGRWRWRRIALRARRKGRPRPEWSCATPRQCISLSTTRRPCD